MDLVSNATVSSFMSSYDSHSRWNSGNDVVCDVGVCGSGV